jgi:hypothetical protein
MRALKLSIQGIRPVARRTLGDDAADHMEHYLDNSGNDYTIDLKGMIDEVPSARALYEEELRQAREFIEQLPEGFHLITSIQAQGGYNKPGESKNWYFAVGGYSAWGKGSVRITAGPGGREYTFWFEYKFFDRYNWDTGKSVRLSEYLEKIPTWADIEITDEFMGEFHRQGLAREFNMHGTYIEKYQWRHGDAVPKKVPLSGPPSPPDGR